MNDIDTLMQRIDEINAKPATELTAEDTDDIIAYHRRNRAKKYGPKVEKPTMTEAGIDDLRQKLLGSMPKPETQTFTRKV